MRPAPAVHLADGIKIGEVTDRSAIVWVRLTAAPERNVEGLPWPDGADALPEGRALGDMVDSAPGAAGKVRLTWWPEGDGEARRSTAWAAVDPDRDHTHQFLVTEGLAPGQRYRLLVEGQGAGGGACRLEGSLRTAPEPGAASPGRFTVVTGQSYLRRDDPARGPPHLRARMLALDPDFFVHTGDVVYHDKPGPFAKSPALARYKWNRIYAMPLQRAVPRPRALVVHDRRPRRAEERLLARSALRRPLLGRGPRHLPRADPHRPEALSPRAVGEGPGGVVRGGPRVPQPQPHGRRPREVHLGSRSRRPGSRRPSPPPTPPSASSSPPRPSSVPDRSSKKDNHANAAFRHEGDELRAFLASQPERLRGLRRPPLAVRLRGPRPRASASTPAARPRTSTPAASARRAAPTPTATSRSAAASSRSASSTRTGAPTLAFRHRAADGTSLNHEDRPSVTAAGR